ncbi:LacI family DNA-binding transcriptional regulator [Nonomuraea roseoviolacea]|uniref:LacI family transcriptional regulator n=1 Tax=Nonomuraea roseoviolacea subsp. carminata TaxID=160689 RepID=A0ABT1KBU1_9ACTN|nr:LacI family DNA-binding transcriptional regulator [Nonomuraea roseoviolacea]MCP2351162.1 LacI family transcriptional regulator [Nonomuraea roseoviolacea subsp. carminata]
MSSIKEVARLAGVSVGTVSNVLNRPELVAQETRLRVQAAVAQLGYVRNGSARHLRAGRSRTIGVVALDLSNPFVIDVLRGVEAAAETADLNVMVVNSSKDAAREARLLEMFEEERPFGVLITPVNAEGQDRRLGRLVARGIPVVVFDNSSRQGRGCAVAADDVLGGRLAGLHLRERGHRHIAFAGGPFTVRQVEERHQGLAGAMTPGDRLTVIPLPDLTVATGRTAGEQVAGLSRADRPTAVFCANDLVALGVLQELTRHGLRVPDDVAILGYDDIDFAAAAAVPLSSIRQPREQLGHTAALMLLEEANQPDFHEHRQVIFQPDLVERASTARAR